jgi:predicted transcriptional regulator
MKYRSRTDIVAQILEIANDGSSTANKTKIMYGAYLSYAQLKEYLGVLLESGLLEQDPASNNQFYRTTQKGWQFLKLYNSIGELANSSSSNSSTGNSNSNDSSNINNRGDTTSSSSSATAAVIEKIPKDTTTTTTTATVKIIRYKKK